MSKSPKPVAWIFELATAHNAETGEYSNWSEPKLSLTKPCVPEGSIRNLMPLFSEAAYYPEPMLVDGVPPAVHSTNPVVQHNGVWGFWNETWNEWHGGYNTEKQARDALIAYARNL